MIRLNYHAPERILSMAVMRDFWRLPQVRRALTAALTVAFFIVVVWGVESYRLRNARDRLTDMQIRYEVIDKRRTTVEGLIAQVRALKLLRKQIGDVRQSGADRVAELVAIGNRLPKTVYLEEIRPIGTTWHLTGHALSIDDLGLAVHALAGFGGGTPRLVDLHEETVLGVSRVRYTIDIERVKKL